MEIAQVVYYGRTSYAVEGFKEAGNVEVFAVCYTVLYRITLPLRRVPGWGNGVKPSPSTRRST